MALPLLSPSSSFSFLFFLPLFSFPSFFLPPPFPPSSSFSFLFYCPNHHHIHLHNTSNKSHTWFAFITLPEMACFCRKRDICRRVDGYFFKGFSTTGVKKICRALPR